MGSIMAAAVAREVLEKTRAGERPIISQIAIKKGYAVSSANTCIPQKTKTYQDIIAADTENTKLRMSVLRRQALRLAKRKAKDAKYGDLVSASDTMTKNIQLLSGGRINNDMPIPIIHVFNFVPKPSKNIKKAVTSDGANYNTPI